MSLRSASLCRDTKKGEELNLPDNVTIVKIEAAALTGKRPRIVGRNARMGVHGQVVREPVVRLHTDAGVDGWGWSAATTDDAQQLVGKRLDQVFDPDLGTLDTFLRFDLPLWDLAGRVFGKAVHAMLGDRGCNPVPVYDGSIYMDDLDFETGQDIGLEPVLNAIHMGLDAGFRAFKLKVGRGYKWMDKQVGFERDVELLHAVRATAGPEVRILIDANNGYTPSEARELMRQAGDCDIFWFEEPFPEHVEESLAFKAFMREAGWGTLLADGEGTHLDTDAHFTRILRAGGVDVVQFDFRSYPFSKWAQYMSVIVETETLAAPHNWASHLLNYYIPQFGRGCERFSMAETDRMAMPGVIADVMS
jgi:D-galactarolactone cycloisomerase